MSESSECLDKEDFNQALIEHVFCHPILYDPAHEDAKNNSKRERVWAGIASDLNESEPFVKTKWKTLRDTYIKYLKAKHVKESGGDIPKGTSQRNYRGWYLAKKMARFKTFFDLVPSTESPAAKPPRKRSLRANNEAMPEVKIEINDFLEANFTDVEVPEVGPGRKSKRLKTKHPSFSSPVPQTVDDPETIVALHQRLSETPHLPRDGLAMDDIDYLMLGYAQTIKKFSLRGQANVKLKIAMLVNEQEIKELEDQS